VLCVPSGRYEEWKRGRESWRRFLPSAEAWLLAIGLSAVAASIAKLCDLEASRDRPPSSTAGREPE